MRCSRKNLNKLFTPTSRVADGPDVSSITQVVRHTALVAADVSNPPENPTRDRVGWS